MVATTLPLLAVILLGAVRSVAAGSSHGEQYDRRSHQRDRWLQANFFTIPCNQILDSWTRNEVSTILEDAINRDIGGTEGFVINLQLQGGLLHGVQIRKLCASCLNVDQSADAFSDACGADDYGNDATFSGLMMVPLQGDGTFVRGTMKGMIFGHPTKLRDVPSVTWAGGSTDIEVLFNVAAASFGNIVLIPDYMGYGESAGDFFMGYIVKKAYQTSFVPLWLRAEQIIADETDCRSALADAASLVGYSEGGYSILAISDALWSLGVHIIEVNAGAVPIRIAVTIRKIIEKVDLGLFPSRARYTMAMIGAAYSSTYQDVANYNAGQDLLRSEVRDEIVDALKQSLPPTEVNDLVPEDDPLFVFDPDILTWFRAATSSDVENPCESSDIEIDGFVDLLCQAVTDNELIDMVEQTPYPINFCHSPDDDVVDISNLPDFDANPLLSFQMASGTHTAAGGFCIFQGLVSLLGPEVQGYEVITKHSETGCVAGSAGAPFDSPTPAPTSLSSSETSHASRIHHISVPYSLLLLSTLMWSILV